MSTPIEDKNLTTATVATDGDGAGSRTDARAVTVAGAPPEVFAAFRDKFTTPKEGITFQKDIPNGTYSVTAKATVVVPANTGTTVQGTLRMLPNFDESRVSISPADRFATLARNVVGDFPSSPSNPRALTLTFETNPKTPIEINHLKIVATRINNVASNTELKNQGES